MLKPGMSFDFLGNLVSEHNFVWFRERKRDKDSSLAVL